MKNKKYLEPLAIQGDTKKSPVIKSHHTTVTTELKRGLFFRVDFARCSALSGSKPVSCSIRGLHIPFVGNWRDLLVAITEFCISEFPEKTKNLRSKWFSNYINTPYLLSKKPSLNGRKIPSGYWINVHYSIPQLANIIARLCRYCGISLDDVKIIYTPKEAAILNDVNRTSFTHEVDFLQKIRAILETDYRNGFVFDATTIRLLENKAEIKLDDKLQSQLKRLMFRRNDGIYFFADRAINNEHREELKTLLNNYIKNFGCFELPCVYSAVSKNFNSAIIRDVADFEDWLSFSNITPCTRCVAYKGTRIVRKSSGNIRNLMSNIVASIYSTAHEELAGEISEDDLTKRFAPFSTELLEKVIKDYTKKLIKTEINGIVCYQTLDVLGLPDEFSVTLAKVLGKIEELGLTPSEEVLHTAL